MTRRISFAHSLRQAAPIVRRGAGLLAIVALMVVGFAATASANLDRLVNVHVPFGFTVGQTALPSGDYEVERRGANVLIFRKLDGSASAAVTTTPIDVDHTAQAALVFNKYGETYFLAQARSLNGTVDVKVPQSKAEQRLARSMGEPSTVTLQISRR